MNSAFSERTLGQYQRVPYKGVADPETQIRGLHALARIHGLQPAPPAACRVLELGCASGRNLLSQAAEFPESHFVGVDAAAAQVAAGQSVAAEAQLSNVQLHHASIEDVDASWGQYDYLLCPGVFSWVRPEIQDRIFHICRENLSADGVAVITYNVLPGWYFQNVARDLMRCHIAPIDIAEEQIIAARQILEFAAEQCPPASLQGQVFRRERDYLRTVQDEYLYHDYLVDENRPVYFQQFMQRAVNHGLQLICDASLAKQSGSFMPPAVQQVLANTPLLQRCQLLDFLRNESFHKTLLTHADQPVDHRWRPETLRGAHVILIDVPHPAEFDAQTTRAVELSFPAGKLTTRDRLGKAALRQLIRHRPRPLALEDLHRVALASLPESGAADEDRGEAGLIKLAGAMIGALQAGLVKLFLDPPEFCPEVTARPLARSPARVWAARGELVVNQLHENIRLTEPQAFVLSLLDGSRTQRALADALAQATAEGRSSAARDEDDAEKLAAQVLSDLSNLALLVG